MWNGTVSELLRLAFETQHNTLETLPSCQKYQWLIPFTEKMFPCYGWTPLYPCIY